MKKVNLIIRCVFDKIKKKFFKYERNNINRACVELQNMQERQVTDEEKMREEYAQNYSITTRWQTV